MTAAEDYAPFNAVWNQPDGGLHTYLVRFLGSSDQTFQHIAVWVGRVYKLCAPFVDSNPATADYCTIAGSGRRNSDEQHPLVTNIAIPDQATRCCSAQFAGRQSKARIDL